MAPDTTRPSIEDVIRRHEPELLQIPGVTGVGISWEGAPGAGEQVILVFAQPAGFDEGPPEIPEDLEGWRTVVRPPLNIG
jgi:hypothetical protein